MQSHFRNCRLRRTLRRRRVLFCNESLPICHDRCIDRISHRNAVIRSDANSRVAWADDFRLYVSSVHNFISDEVTCSPDTASIKVARNSSISSHIETVSIHRSTKRAMHHVISEWSCFFAWGKRVKPQTIPYQLSSNGRSLLSVYIGFVKPIIDNKRINTFLGYRMPVISNGFYTENYIIYQFPNDGRPCL